MVLDEDVRTTAGLLLVPRGQPVTVAVVQRLRSFARGQGVREPFRVRIPDPSVLSASASPLEPTRLPRRVNAASPRVVNSLVMSWA